MSVCITRSRGAVHAGRALREGEERPGVPNQAADRGGSGDPGQDGGVRIPVGRCGLPLRGPGRVQELARAGLPFVMALKPRRGIWAYGDSARTPVNAARELALGRAAWSRRLTAGDPHLP